MANLPIVLVVDDERIIADSLATILRGRGYRAQAAYSADEALFAADRVHPQVLISDVMMPGMNGIELSLEFAQKFPACKVLLVSGNTGTAALLAESERRGNTHTILPKPVHPLQIFDYLANCSSA